MRPTSDAESFGALHSETPGYFTVRVHFGTNRKQKGSSDNPHKIFGDDRGAAINYGQCEVSIPKDHRMGQLEAPSFLRFQFNDNPHKHIVLLTVETKEKVRFFEDLRQTLNDDQSKVFVFVHGYNVSFEDAARRTAQLAYDLEFKGIPVFFSWPSQAHSISYAADETNAHWTVPDLATFLRDLASKTHTQSIYLIAHSMGNRCVTEALERLASEKDGIPKEINEVILTAPDIDADTFRAWIPKYLGAERHFTLYASSVDKALAASKKFHKFPRAGDSGEGLVVVPPMDTIDATAVDTSFMGHSYYGDERALLSDLYWLMRDRTPPPRFGLMPVSAGDKTYWKFRP